MSRSAEGSGRSVGVRRPLDGPKSDLHFKRMSVTPINTAVSHTNATLKRPRGGKGVGEVRTLRNTE